MSDAPRPVQSRANTKKELPEKFKSYRHVWVYVEFEHGRIHPVSLELLGEGRKLASKLNVELVGALIGGDRTQLTAAAAECHAFGADLVYLVADPALEHYRNYPYTKALTDLVETFKPEILLLGATTLGRDLAGSVATTLRTGLTADCTELAIDDERSLAATRPTFGGSLLCTIHTLNYRPQMATVRPRVMAMPAPDLNRSGRVIEHPLGLAEDDIVRKCCASFRPRVRHGAARLCRYRCRRWSRTAFAGELPTGQGPRSGAGRRTWRLTTAGAERLDRRGSADRPNRQDDPAQAVYRGRNIRRHPASGGRGGCRHDRCDQHRSARPDLRFCSCRRAR